MTIEGLGEMGRDGKRWEERGREGERGGERGGEGTKINRKEKKTQNVVSLKEMSE